MFNISTSTSTSISIVSCGANNPFLLHRVVVAASKETKRTNCDKTTDKAVVVGFQHRLAANHAIRPERTHDHWRRPDARGGSGGVQAPQQRKSQCSVDPSEKGTDLLRATFAFSTWTLTAWTLEMPTEHSLLRRTSSSQYGF